MALSLSISYYDESTRRAFKVLRVLSRTVVIHEEDCPPRVVNRWMLEHDLEEGNVTIVKEETLNAEIPNGANRQTPTST